MAAQIQHSFGLRRRPPRLSSGRLHHTGQCCGVLSVFLAMMHMASGSLTHFLLSAAMTPLAFVFDVFDGKVARWRH
jgi:phosphatidylserine synthase